MVGLAGEGQNFDGNGMYVRFQPGGGDQLVALGGNSAINSPPVFGNAPAKPIGTRPAYPGQRPPYKPDVPCYTQKVPDLNGAATGPSDQNSPSVPRAATSAIARSAARSATRKGALTLRGLKPTTKASNGNSLLGGLNPFGKATP